MENINRKDLAALPELIKLKENWEQWGKEYQQHKDTKGKQGQTFSWRSGIRQPLIKVLEEQTSGHCSFCDGHPIGDTSLEPIEHYHPKADYPLKAYEWSNLFYCCDKCNSEANKAPFELTLKPDDKTYDFSNYFYFDLASGKLIVLENLEQENPTIYKRATAFLKRYGINGDKRIEARKHLYYDIRNFFKQKCDSDKRVRVDFKYRYVFDFVEELQQLN